MAKKTATETENNATADAPASEKISERAKVKAVPAKKITIKSVSGDVKAWFAQNAHKNLKLVEQFEAGKLTSIPICRLYGRVTKTRPGNGDHGPFVRFDGKFFGIDLLGAKNPIGTVFTAGTCLLPKWLEAQIDAAHSENGDPVDFGFDIKLAHAPAASLGYEYVADELLEPSSDVENIGDKFPAFVGANTLLALPAPEGEKAA